MKAISVIGGLLLTLSLPFSVNAQAPVVATPDQSAMLSSPDPKLGANKRLVYDFWREVLEAGQMQQASKYLTESYIQHNPNIASGRDALVTAFSSRPTKPVEPKIKRPLVSVVAEGDLVVMSFVSEVVDPNDANKKYTTTAFEMFRIEAGKIAEHWDNMPLRSTPIR